MNEEYTKCPKCGSIEIAYIRRFDKYKCLDCGHIMSKQEFFRALEKQLEQEEAENKTSIRQKKV